jgi:diguanylate cyclase (GGDEF)-like protein
LSRLIGLTLALFIGWVGLVAGSEAQGQFLFKTYGPEQGLSQPALITLVQDASGFIWIASENGLIRYDGTTFRKWTEKEGLPSAAIENIEVIPDGGLWVATRKGLVRFQDGRATPLLLDGKPLEVRGRLMHLGGDGTLWMLREDGLLLQRGAQGVERVSGSPPGWAKALAVRESTGSVFMAVGDGLWERRKDGAVARLAWGGQGLAQDVIEGLAVDGNDRLWVVGARSLCYQDAGTAVFHNVSSWLPAAPFIDCIIKTNPDGSLAIPTNAGLLRIHGDGHDLIGPAQGLPFKWTVSSLVDREGSLWIAGSSLCRLLGRGQVRSFTSQDGLPSDLVWCTCRDHLGRLWAGTSDGAALLGPAGWSRVAGTEGLSVTALVEDAQGRLWIGSNNGVPFCLEPGRTRATDLPFRSLRGLGSEARPTRSTSLTLDHAGQLWLADPSHGVYRLDLKARILHAEYHPWDGKTVYMPRFLREDVLGRIWVASNLGLACLDAGGWHRWTKADGLGENLLQGLLPAADGTCWLIDMEATGLKRVSWKDGIFKVVETLDTAHGLASDRVYSAGLDSKGSLWVGHDRGVDRVQGGEIVHFTQGGGLPGEDCSGNGIMVEPAGDIWLGMSTGLAHLTAGPHPGLPPSIQVSILQVQRGKALLTPPFAPLPALSHLEGTLEFHFSSPTYLDERAVTYQVRLAGLEEEWRRTDVPQARYAALPRGRYRFEVRAAYPGQPFGPEASYAVQVLGPWWRALWFDALCALGGVGLVALFVRGRLRTLANQKARLAALVDERTSELLKANVALKQANLALKAQSLTDPLTGLQNRRFLSVVVEEDVASVARAYRDGPEGLVLANEDLVFFLVDLDFFKLVNDQHGHAAGDQVLVKVAAALRQAARESDAVIRWGGEEFLIMARKSSRCEAHLMAERITSIMAQQELVLDSGEVVRWTCSVGYAAFPFQLDDPAWIGWERLMEIVDACLYLAKRTGRNAWVGAEARAGLARSPHSARLPWELVELRDEGVLDLHASRPVLARALTREV